MTRLRYWIGRPLLALVVCLMGVQGHVQAQRPKVLANKVVDGIARNKLTYHLRVPGTYNVRKGLPALLFLHGENRNSRTYLETIVRAWPELARDYILIGINGETRVADSLDDSPEYNYTYINFMGKSRYKGVKGRSKQSPILVVGALREIQSFLTIKNLFVGGQHQGGFLTYILALNFPDLFAGAFPMSAGLLRQSEPRAFSDKKLRKAQREIPFAILHGTRDGEVSVDQSLLALFSLEDDGFPMVRYFGVEGASGAFSALPLPKAIEWLELMTSTSLTDVVKGAQQSRNEGAMRDHILLVNRAKGLDRGRFFDTLARMQERVREDTLSWSEKLTRRMRKSSGEDWIEEFLDFRSQFGQATAARDILKEYDACRRKHEKHAKKLFEKAKGDEFTEDFYAATKKYQEIVSKYYCSSYYWRAKWAVDDAKE